MVPSPSRPRRVSAHLLLLLGLALLVTGCAPASGSQGQATATRRATADVSAPVSIVSYSTTVNASEEGDHHLAASASCTHGEQMLGGGYDAESVFESAFFLDASYPSGPATWTVKSNSISHYQLTALVYCLQAYPDLGVQILRGQGCPSGAVALALGVDGASHYALCASRHVSRGSAPGSFRIGGLDVSCGSHSTGSAVNPISETRSFLYTCAAR